MNKAELNKFLKNKKHQKYPRPVKARIEAVLRCHGIDYAAYHGGDLVGNDCRKLMERAPQIFADVQVVLLEVAVENGMG